MADKWLYGVVRNSEEPTPMIYVAEENFWQNNKCLDDHSGAAADIMPSGFEETMESVYEYTDGEIEDMVAALNAAGLVHSQEVEDFANSCLNDL